jgi:hypothetical protein
MDLQTARVRHSMLLGTYMQLKTYLDCIEHGYLGKLLKDEQEMMEDLKKAKESTEKVLKYYFDTEERLMN